MQGLDGILASSGMDVGALAQQFGLDHQQANSALGSLIPAIAGGFQKRAEQGDLAPVTQATNGMGQPDTATGNDVLGQIFGGKDVSRQVADHASGQSGVSSTVLKAMLPVVAAMVARHVAQSSGGNGQGDGAGFGGSLGGILGSVLGAGASAGGPMGGGLGGLGAMLGGGNPLDAILNGRR
jgi:hypothetical protein